MTRGQKIPTGRSWRDLPPGPPSRFVPTPVAEPAPTTAVGHKTNPWPFVIGAVGIVAVGFLVGLGLPRDADAEPTGTTLSLPDVIVPPAPTTLPTNPLQPDLEEPFVDELFTVPNPPAGFTVEFNYTQSSSDHVEQTAVLTDQTIHIKISAAVTAADPELPAGDPVQVRGQSGVVDATTEGRYALSWVEPGKILFTIDAPEAVPVEELVRLAESLEVT